MPAEQEEVIGAVGFFEDDYDRVGAADAALVIQTQAGKVGGFAVCVISPDRTDCSGGCNADCASAEEFDGQPSGGRNIIPADSIVAIITRIARNADSIRRHRIAERWLFGNPEGPVESVIRSIVDA